MFAYPSDDGDFAVVTTAFVYLMQVNVDAKAVLTTRVMALPAGMTFVSAVAVPHATGAVWRLHATVAHGLLGYPLLVAPAEASPTLTVDNSTTMPLTARAVCDARLCAWFAPADGNNGTAPAAVHVQDVVTGTINVVPVPELDGAVSANVTVTPAGIAVASWRTVVGISLKLHTASIEAAVAWHQVLGTADSAIGFVGSTGHQTLFIGVMSHAAQPSQLHILDVTTGNTTTTLPLPANVSLLAVLPYPQHSLLLTQTIGSSWATWNAPDVRAFGVRFDFVTRDITSSVSKSPAWGVSLTNSSLGPVPFPMRPAALAVAATLAPSTAATRDCVAVPYGVMPAAPMAAQSQGFLALRVTDGRIVANMMPPLLSRGATWRSTSSEAPWVSPRSWNQAQLRSSSRFTTSRPFPRRRSRPHMAARSSLKSRL